MPGLPRRERMPFPFYGAQVQQARAFHVAYVGEHPHDTFYVVSVERSEISYVKPFEDVLLSCEQAFEAVVEPQHGAPAALAGDMQLLEQLVCLVAEGVVGRGGGKVCEVVVEGADVVVDAHVVVVKDNEQVVVGVGGVVYSFECEAAALWRRRLLLPRHCVRAVHL